MMKRAAWGMATMLAWSAPAFADEPAKQPDKKEPDKKVTLPPDGPKETGSASPESNPWADAGLSKPHDGQQRTAAPSTTAPRRPSKTDDLASTPISAAVLAGYASESLKIGFGVQAGYTIYGVYLGATFVYHLGTSEGSASAHVLYPGAEVGYDFFVEGVVVRPYVGVDYALFTVSLGSQSTSKGYLGLHPGLHVDYAVPETPVFVGVDGRVLLIPDVLEDSTPSIGVFLVVGGRF